ncbi:YDG domain-containing protein [Hominenteromicrobium sp.]|uniref:YDG domain-containing protein n=1 Tax=Hominenteromicrobium sp. TaxID=3073581 RepID=UPI003AB4463E
MKKRVLSLLMALTLCLTTLPTAVFADVTENGEGSGGTHYVAESGGTQYETVQEILDNMEEGEITLLDSVTEDLTVSAATTIHMNGHSITGNIDATDSLTLNGGTVDGTVKVDGGTLNMTAPSDAAAAIDGGLNVVSGSAFVSGAQVGVKGTLYFDGTDMLISGAVKAVELDSAAEPAAKTLYGSATVNGDTAAEAGFNTDTYKVGGEIAKKLTNKQVGSTTPAAPSLTLTETSKSLTAGKTAVFTANYTGTDTLNAYVQSNAVNGCFTISQKNNGDGTYTVSVKIDEETPGGTYTLFVHELGNTSVQASATITVTGLPDAAEVNGKQYKSLPRALDAAQDGDTVKLLADHTTNWSDVEAGEYATLAVVKKTLTLDLNGMTVDYLTVGDVVSDEEGGILDSYDGNLTVVENVQGGSYGKIKNLEFVKGSLAIQGGRIGDFDGSKLTCKENSGTVTISGGMVCNATVGDGATVTVSGGTMHQGEWVNNGTLNIKGGTFGAVNFHNNSGTIAISGGTFSTLKNYDNTSSFPIAPISLLAPGHAFYKDNTVQDGSRRDFLQDVTVKEHTHTMVNNKCACGFSCTHTNTEGASTIGEDGKCTACGTQFAAGIGETYYTDVPSALDAATDGQTVKLLANTMLPSDTYVSKTLTLDLDGHSLSGYSLNVGGLTPTSQVRTGKLTVIDSSGGNGAVGVTVRDGGTLVFDPKNDHTPLLQLEVWGGTVELYGGKISRSGLRLNNGITLGDLLPQKAGLAYYRDDTQLTLEEATSQTCDLVVKSCSHGGKNGFGNNSTACPYCNAPAVAETALYNGEGNRLQRRFADLQTALDADRDGGATLKLLADVTGDYTIDGTQNTGLDLNGYSIKGTVTVKAAAGSTTTTLSNTKNTTTASIDNVVAHRGANLAGSGKPAVIGTLTLAEGATWKTILNDTALGYKMLNADGTHKWYARDDVKGSQLNNVIINRLPITTKILNLKVDGKNLTKVERGTTVQLCASCNAKDVTVTFSILKTGETTPITLSGNDVQYTTVGTGTTKFYVAEYAFNDVGSYTISFTATKDGYTVTSNHKKLTVTKPNLSNAEITFPYGNEAAFNYVTATGVPTFIVTYKGQTLKKDVDFTIAGGDSTYDVGSCTLTIKATDNGDYTGSKSAEWKVRPLKVEASVGDIIKTYDGTTDLPANTKITFKSADSYYTGTTLRLAKGKDYEVSNAHYDSADASETEKTVSFTIKLKNAGYVFEDGTTQKDFTLNGADFDDKTFQINKATIDQSNTQLYQTVFNDLAKTYEIDLNQVLDKILPEGGKYGDIQYGKPSVFMNSDYYPVGGATIGNGNLSLSINKAASSNQGDEIGTVTVQVETTNYQPFTLTIHVSLQDKLVLVLAEGNTVSASEITYGQTLADSKLTVNGTMKDPNTSATVDGTFTWTDGTIKPDAGSYDAEWTFTPAEGYEEYATATGTVTVKVAPKSIEGATITLKKREFTYNAAEQSPTITGVMLKGWSETITTYDIVSGDKAINANDSITLTIKGTGNYTGTATAEWKIIPAKLTVSVPSEVKKEYDGTTNATVTPTFNGLRGKDNLTAADYSVTAAFDNAKVGYKKTVIGKVTLNQTETAKNYVLTNDGNFSTDDGTITKAVAPTVQPVELTIYNGVQADYYVDLPSLPDMGKGKSYGTVGYRKTHTINLSEGYKAQSDLRADPENLNTLRLLLHMTQTGSLTGEIGTVTIPVTTSNYQDITLTVKISAKNRITPTGTPTLSKNAIIYGDALNTIALSGKLHDNVNNVDVDGTFEWVDGTHIPVVGNGTYAAEWIFEPTDTEKYLTVSGRSNITVEKARQYGKLSMAGYTYGKTPSTPTLTDQTGDLNAQVTYSYAAADSGSVQTWDISNPPALNAGTYRMYASIGDTDNYYGFEAVYCEFVVAKATPTYTVPTGLTAKYGQTLADVTLPDGWSWMDSSESVGGASTAAKTFQAKFTPKDTENYNTVENIELEVTVNKADGGNFKTVELEQKYTDASDHTYTPDWAGLPAGQDWTFSSEASIVLPKQDFAADGNLLTYAISGGKAGDKITLILKASCDNYENFTITLNVTLTEKDDQKPLTITGNTSVIYGEKLTLTTTGGSGMGAVTYRIDNAISTGEATIDPNTGVLTPVKVGSVSVIATKAGDNNYNDVTSAPFVLMIKPATPTGEPNYTIKATAGAGGSISPSGNVSVREGGDQTFTITPDKGYAVANVKIDGKSIGAVKSYTFENVSSPHTIEAIFVKGTASASTGDSSNLPLWSALLLASTLALAGAVHLKRKRAR